MLAQRWALQSTKFSVRTSELRVTKHQYPGSLPSSNLFLTSYTVLILYFWFFFFSAFHSQMCLQHACKAWLAPFVDHWKGAYWASATFRLLFAQAEMSQNVRSLSRTWITPCCHAFASIALMSTVEYSRLCFMAIRGHCDRSSRSLLLLLLQ